MTASGSAFDELCAQQAGVFTRQQALACGITAGHLRAQVRSGRWYRVRWRIYTAFTGPLTRDAQMWVAVLAAGQGATLSHATAAELNGLADKPAPFIHLTIPSSRRTAPIAGVVVHISAHVDAARHPSQLPPRTRVEETVLDLTQTARDLDEAIGWLAKACGRRLTTAARLAQALIRRSRVRWRLELATALVDVATGCHSLLELRYLRTVERAHGLPPGERQSVRKRRGGRYYDDVLYREYRTRVELDGNVAHPDEALGRDMRRDNAAVIDGDTVLRYGVPEVTGTPCAVGGEVGAVLQRNGWPGRLKRCGPSCQLR